MSIFYCYNCGHEVDADYAGCEYDPSDPTKEVCTECAEEIMEGLRERENPMKAYGLKEGDFL